MSAALKTRRYCLGKAVRFLRELKNLNQRELAGTSGIDATEISRLEKGKSNPTHETLQRLAKGLDGPGIAVARRAGLEGTRTARAVDRDAERSRTAVAFHA